MNIKTILTMIDKYGETNYYFYDREDSVSCPFCGVRYHLNTDIIGIPCSYCAGIAHKAGELADSIDSVITNSNSIDIETLKKIRDNVTGYYQLELNRRIKYREDK